MEQGDHEFEPITRALLLLANIFNDSNDYSALSHGTRRGFRTLLPTDEMLLVGGVGAGRGVETIFPGWNSLCNLSQCPQILDFFLAQYSTFQANYFFSLTTMQDFR